MEPSTNVTSGSRKGPLPCEICQENPSKYMCPRCGVPYCSLTCYRNPEKHLQCSESFYRDCIVEDIKSEEKNNSCPERAKKMEEILQRVHQQYSGEEGEGTLSDEEEVPLDSDDDEPLAKRLEGIDLNNADLVWSHLTEEERREFQNLARNMEVAGDLIPEWVPWWNEPPDRKLVVDVDVEEDTPTSCSSDFNFLKLHGRQPDWLHPIPKMSDLTKVKPNQNVANGLINVIAAYVWTARLFNGDLLDEEKVVEVASCLIYLSTFLNKDGVFRDVEHAIADVPLNACRVPSLSEGGDSIQVTLSRDIWVITKGPKESQSPSSPSSSSKVYLLSALTECYNVFIAASKILKRKNNTNSDSAKSSTEFSKLFPPPPPVLSADLKLVQKAKRKLLYLLAFANEFMEPEEAGGGAILSQSDMLA